MTTLINAPPPGGVATHHTDPVAPVGGMAHTRRRLLATAAGAAAVAALPAVAAVRHVAVTIDPDPHPAWAAEWARLIAYVEGDDRPRGVELDDLPEWRRAQELERLIGDTAAATLAGAAAQVRFAAGWLEEYGDLYGGGEDAMRSAVATLDRLAGGAAHA